MNNNHETIKVPKTSPRAMPFGGRGVMARGIVEKPKDFKGTIKKLAGYLKPFWFKMLLVFIFAITSTIFAIISPKMLGQATNQIVGDYISPDHIFHLDIILNIILFLVVLYLISAALSYIQGWIMSGITQKITYQFRKDISEKINRLPLRFFRSEERRVGKECRL